MSTQQTPVSTNHPTAARFSHQTYLVRKKFWQFFGGSFYIYDPNGALIPQSFDAQIGGRTVATFSQHFNLFATKLTLDFSADPQHQFDRRIGIAAGILLCAIEGKQQSN